MPIYRRTRSITALVASCRAVTLVRASAASRSTKRSSPFRRVSIPTSTASSRSRCSPTIRSRSKRRSCRRRRSDMDFTAQGGAVPFEHRIPERPARAHLGFRQPAARLPGVSRRAVRRRRAATQVAGADRPLSAVRCRSRQRPELPGLRSRHQRRWRLGRSTGTSAAMSATATPGAPACRTSARGRTAAAMTTPISTASP